MTDKQIIIDGIDVSGCEYWKGYCRIASLCDYPGHLCEVNPNCYYKQLKRAEKTMQEIWDRLGKTSDELLRKEQECEELKNDNHTLLVTRQKLLNDLWIAEESLKDFKEICDKQCEQLEAYKMEADEGKEINAELKAELEQEKALKETYLACYKAKHEDIEGKLFKLSKTLTEIKEIAEAHKKDESVWNPYRQLDKILQKISEVEND